MDKALKQRMVGAVVLIALAVIFIPMLLNGHSEQGTRTVSLDIPSPPDEQYRSRLLPLEGEGDAKQEAASDKQVQGQVARQQASKPSEAATTAGPGAGSRPEPSSTGSGPAASAPASTEPEEPPAEPEQSEPKPTAGQPASGDSAQSGLTNWFVQVGSFSSKDNALELRDRLRNAGYTAFVDTSTVNGATTHRVKVGPEMDKARAEKDRTDIQDKFGLEGLVISEP